MSSYGRAPSPGLRPGGPVRDPLRLCIFTTIALLAWLLTPPLVVAFFAGMGLWAYGRAYRAGLRSSKCILKDARLVMTYLGVLFAAGAYFTVRNLFGLFS